MSGMRIMDAMGELPEDLLTPVAELRKKKKIHWTRWAVVAAACLCLLLIPWGWNQSRDMKAESMQESPKEELTYGSGDHSNLTADSIVYSFRGEVLEVYETPILVRPLEGEDELRSGDKIEVSLYQVQNVPEITVGDTVEIFYGGQLQEVYPPRATDVTQIRIVK